MAGLSNPRGIYGVHSVTPYRRDTGEFFGTLKVVKGSSLNVEGTTNSLMGGSSKYPWAVEDGEMKCEASLKFAEYADFLFELFFGKAVTSNAAEASGSVGALTAVSGSLIGTTGIASAAVDAATKANLKLARYVIKVVSPTTVDVYASSDVDFARGSSLAFQDDGLRVTVNPLTITSAGNIVIPGTGIALTGGSGTIAMNIGDTATIWSRPVNQKSTTVRVGGTANQTMPEFGCIVVAQKRGNGELTEIDLFRCKGSGMPLGFEANAWSEAEVKVQAFYDSVKDGVFDFRHIVT